MSSSFLHNLQDSNITHGRAKVYIRNYKKNAIILTLDTPIPSKELIHKISTKFRQQINDFVLFYSGKLLDQSDTLIALHNDSIIHLVDIRRTITTQLRLTFKVQKNPKEIIKVKVSPQTNIREVLLNQIKPVIGKGETEVFLVYLGKPMNIFKKFSEEFVENQSEILVVQFRDKDLEHKQKKNIIDVTQQSLVKRIASIAQSIRNLAPNISNRSRDQTEKIRQKLMKKVEKKPLVPSPTTFSKEKPQFNSIFQEAAPGQDVSSCFNPHQPTAPDQNIRKKKEQVKHSGNLIEKEEQKAAPPQNPQYGGPQFKQADFIFSGEMNLEETQQVVPSLAKELKQSLKKKSQSQGSQQSKGKK